MTHPQTAPRGTPRLIRGALTLMGLAAVAIGCSNGQRIVPEETGTKLAERGALHQVPIVTLLRGEALASTNEGAWIVRGSVGTPGGPFSGRSGSRAPVTGALRRPSMPADDPTSTRDSSEAVEGVGAMRPGVDGGGAPRIAAPASPARPTSPAIPTPMTPSPGPVAPGMHSPVAPSPTTSSPGTSAPMRSPAAPSPMQSGTPLKAGSTDDNAEYEAYLKFLATWLDKPGVADRARDIDVRGRRFVRVLDQTGRPVPAAQVTFVDEVGDRVAWQGTTLGDGRMMFFPGAIKGDAPDTWRVEVCHGGHAMAVHYRGSGDLEIALPGTYMAPETVALDVCFVIDTTGSMSDEIERIKRTLLSVTDHLKGMAYEFDLRYGAVLYRDLRDQYVTKQHPFTGDIKAFAKALADVRATGGGDAPESMNQGLSEAVGRMDWREGAAKLCFLVADAPPHMDYEGDVGYDVSMRAALEKGIRIHSVAASGLDAFGSLVMRQVAQFTGGRFIFIEYNKNVAASGAAHGVGDVTKSNNLDDIIFERVQDEIAGWGRAPALDLATISLAAPVGE